MPRVIVKRITLPESKQQAWEIVGQHGDVPDGLTIGINGGYAGLWSAVADYDVGRQKKSAKAHIVRMWTDYVSDTGYEQTRYAEVELEV